MDLDHQALPNENAYSDGKEQNRPAVVKRINPEAEGICLHFRAKMLEIERIPVTIEDILEHASPDHEAKIFLERDIRNALYRIGDNLEDQGLREQFTTPEISTRELIDVLAYSTEDEYLSFVDLIADHVPNSTAAKEFFESKFDNALEYAATDEKVILATKWFQASSEDNAGKEITASILRSSESWAELHTLVSLLGEEELMNSEHRPLQEYAALATVGKQLKLIEIPEIEEDKINDITEKEDELRRYFEDQLCVIESLSEIFGKTNAFREFKASVEFNARYFEEDLKNGTEEERRELLKVLLKKIDIELSYGLHLTHQNEFLGNTKTRWDADSLIQVEQALSMLPEGLLLTTPKLFNLKLVDSIGNSPYTLGLRHPSGTVYITTGAFQNRTIGALFPHVRPGAVVLVHEIGHSVQLGNTASSIVSNFDGTFSIAEGDILYDFDEYQKTTGWSLIQPDRYDWTNGGYSVKLDGKEYLMDTPVRIDGKLKVLINLQGFLLMHDAEGEFTIRPYGRVNPWEDWAEAFAEYFLNPHRLKSFAPDKYNYLQQEFGHYPKKE